MADVSVEDKNLNREFIRISIALNLEEKVLRVLGSSLLSLLYFISFISLCK